MALGVRSKKYDYALLECPPDDHSSHLAVRQLRGDSTRELVGAPLTLCAFQVGMQKELQDFRQGLNLEIGLMPAFGCKLSDQRHHLLYDVRSWAGDSGTALVMFEGEVVGMHIEVANTFVEKLDREKEIDQQMEDVAESLAAAASSTAQAGIALLCHVFAK